MGVVDVYGDVIRGTLAELGEDHFTDIATDLQEHVAARELINEHKMKVDGGDELQFNLMIGANNSARAVSLDETDNVNEVDVMTQGRIPWCFTDLSMGIDERTIAMNASNKRRIYDIVKTAKIATMIGWAEKFETWFWGKPATSSDIKTPYGIQMYIHNGSATTTFGFNGGNPTGFSSGVGNLNSSTFPRWANGNCLYTDVSKTDLIAKWREAATMTNFVSAVDLPSYDRGEGPGYYCNYRTLGPVELALENQNERLGTDIASMDGKAMFRGTPITYVPKLQEDTTDPVYGIQWKTIGVKYLAGWFMKEKSGQAPIQHNKRWTFWDCVFNFFCHNRRKNFVLTKS